MIHHAISMIAKSRIFCQGTYADFFGDFPWDFLLVEWLVEFTFLVSRSLPSGNQTQLAMENGP